MSDSVGITLFIVVVAISAFYTYRKSTTIIRHRGAAALATFTAFTAAPILLDQGWYVGFILLAPWLAYGIGKKVDEVHKDRDSGRSKRETISPAKSSIQEILPPAPSKATSSTLEAIARRNAENVAKARGEKIAPPYEYPSTPCVNPLDELRDRLARMPSRPEKPKRRATAWHGNKRVTFEYMDSNGDITTRDVSAVRVDHKNGETYLVGYCMTRRATRTFRADRILGEVIDMETGEVGEFDDIFA